MNILVIGNGFDLAHGLPTKYGDFLEFCERVRVIYDFSDHISLSDYKSKKIDNWDMNDYIKNTLLDAFKNRTYSVEYSCAMKSHFRKSGNQMSGKWKSSCASLLA